MLSIRIPRLKDEHFFSCFLILFWGQDIIFRYARAFFLRIPFVNLIADCFFPCLMLICIIFSFPFIIKHISWKDFFATLMFLIIYLSQIIIYPANSEYLLSIFSTLFISVLPLYFIGLCFDTNKHLKLLYSISILNIWLFAVYTIFIGAEISISSQSAYSSSMHRAYILLPQILVVIGYLFKKPNIINLMTAILGFILLMMCGNRGSVLLLLLFIIIYVIFLLDKRKRWWLYPGFAALVISIIYYFELIVNAMRILFLRLGMSTRVLEHLASGDYFSSFGREVITHRILQAISEKPILGHGLASDRLFVGSYAHNFALELWISFGIFVGTFLLLSTIYIIAVAWLKTKDLDTKIFLLMLLCVGFFKLFISSSYLLEGMFFMLLGVCIRQLRKHKEYGTKNVRGYKNNY